MDIEINAYGTFFGKRIYLEIYLDTNDVSSLCVSNNGQYIITNGQYSRPTYNYYSHWQWIKQAYRPAEPEWDIYPSDKEDEADDLYVDLSEMPF